MIDPKHPFYDAPWRRGLIVGVCFAWGCVELFVGNLIWAAIVGALGLYAAYKLFIERNKV